MEVIVTVGNCGLPVESNTDGLTGIIRQGDYDGLACVGDKSIRVVVTASVAPADGILGTPGGTAVSGKQHHELVVLLSVGVKDGAVVVMVG